MREHRLGELRWQACQGKLQSGLGRCSQEYSPALHRRGGGMMSWQAESGREIWFQKAGFPQGQRSCIGKEMRFSQCLGQACWLGRAPSPHCLNWTSSTPTSIYWSLCTLILIWILSLTSMTTEQVHKFVKFKGGVFSLSKRGIHLVDG